MTSKLERTAGELWTSFLLRRLIAEGHRDLGGLEALEGWDESTTDDGRVISTGWNTSRGKMSLRRSVSVLDIVYANLYSDVTRDLDNLFGEFLYIEESDSDSRSGALDFRFFDNDTVEVCDKSGEPIAGVLSKYEQDQLYNAEEVIEDLVRYVKEAGCDRASYIREKEKEIFHGRSVTYLRDLYARKIEEDLDNLRSFEVGIRRISYVLVDSSDIGPPGTHLGNLLFVARDKAPEEWQQQIVAYHEFLCARIGHDRARKKEQELAVRLGKKEEYLAWRKQIDQQLTEIIK